MSTPDAPARHQLLAASLCSKDSVTGLQHSLSEAFLLQRNRVFCLEHDGTVQWQREGARDIRTAKAFEAQGSPSFYHSECNQRDSVDKELNSVTRNGIDR